VRRSVALSTLLAAALGGIVLVGIAAAAGIGWIVTRELTWELLSQRAVQAIERLERGLSRTSSRPSATSARSRR